MPRLKAIGGYILAVLAVPVVLAVFMGQNFWMKELVDITGVRVSPWLTGGEVVRTIDHGAYRTSVHETVFIGLLGEKKEGMVQIDWAPAAMLPDQITEDIDYDGNGTGDFHIELNTKSGQAILTPLNTGVIPLEKVSVLTLKDGQAVRARIRNPKQ